MTLIDQIREMISEGETEKSLDELYKYVKENNAEIIDSLVMLRSRLKNIEDGIIRGTMDDDDANLERAKVNDAILRLLPQLTPEYIAKNKASTPVYAAPTPAKTGGIDKKWLYMGIGGGAVILLIFILALLPGGGEQSESDTNAGLEQVGPGNEPLLDWVMSQHNGYAVWEAKQSIEGKFSTFALDADNTFTEFQNEGVFASYVIQETTPQYIQLYDDKRTLTIRIYETKAEFKYPVDTQWFKLADGEWVTPQ
ncbi:MAG: hypothetical protein IAE84_07455 [Saprospiraceae bacterium]|jgi:hypothetical protein|nr:hypothetical protein [Saprospiraceae bacterium]HRD79258.1 hypothetical protein [Saprospiraceae bacterium]HRK81074.1 hypothetical protein [Saprospiraceae bacterium]